MRKGIILGGMVIGLLMGCNNGMAELEKKSIFYDSVIKIGHGFQEIFGIFGNAMGEALRFSAVKSTDKRSVVGDHFDKVKKGLGDTNAKLKELSSKISETKNSDGSTIKVVEDVIKEAGEIFEQLIGSFTKLAASSGGNTDLADGVASATNVAGATANDVNAVIAGVKEIIDIAERSGVKIGKGSAGDAVNASGATDAPAAIGSNNVGAGAGPKLSEVVSKADAWAMIDSIKNAKTNAGAGALSGNDKDAGTLATGTASTNGAGAKSTADLAAAVALKAMTKGGKFGAHASNNEAGAVKAAVTIAVNKVLGVLDEIIRRTVNIELGKVKDAVKGIKYSETTGEATEVKK